MPEIPPTQPQEHLGSPRSPSADGSVFSEAEEVDRESEEERLARGAMMGSDEDDDGDDLFDENLMEEDYIPNPELDNYDPSMLDDSTDHQEIDPAERRRLENEMNRRDRNEDQKDSRFKSSGPARYYPQIAAMLNEELDEDEYDDDDFRNKQADNVQWRRRQRYLREVSATSIKPNLEDVECGKEELPICHIIDASQMHQSAKLWNPRIESSIKIIMAGFLWYYSESDENEDSKSLYTEFISRMVQDDCDYLNINWNHLSSYCPQICSWFTNVPVETIKTAEGELRKIINAVYKTAYSDRSVSIRFCGIRNLDSIRSLTIKHVNRLVAVEGVCTRRSQLIPKMNVVWMECLRCKYPSNGPFALSEKESWKKIKHICRNCQKNGPFKPNRERTIYVNYQNILVQEMSSKVPPGHIPRQKSVLLLGSLVNSVRPGDQIIVTGVYQTSCDFATNASQGFPVFKTQLVANNVQKMNELKVAELTHRDIEIIKRLSRNSKIREKIIDSIAPSIWGHRHIKTGIANVMFGGVRNEGAGKHVIRGDINMLIVGDPGMGKSQFLKYVQQSFDRTVLTTGKGASAVGLTAAVRKDYSTGEWCLEGGAFVLADEGICLIDEFDKMSEKDRVSIHEAMEQQSISISKAGIVASLRARCSVIAAANPVFGRYDNSLTLNDNVDLSAPILSRFDVIAVVRDKAFALHDLHLAMHVVDSHIRAHPDNNDDMDDVIENKNNNNNLLQNEINSKINNQIESGVDSSGYPNWIKGSGPIPESVLKQYVSYARHTCRPELRSCDSSKLIEFYARLRDASCRNGGMPLTVRHFESIIRVATSNAKMRLSRFVEKSDVDFAISTILESFIQSQKVAIASDLSCRFSRYRVLASSSDEYLESLLMDLFSRKLRDALSRLESSCESELNNVQISVEEFLILSKSLHGLPEVVIHQFMKGNRFLDKFTIQKIGSSAQGVIVRKDDPTA